MDKNGSFIKIIIGFVNAIAIFAIIFLFLKNYTVYKGETKIIHIKEGSSNRQIAELLEKEGIVANKDIFYFYTQIKNLKIL